MSIRFVRVGAAAVFSLLLGAVQPVAAQSAQEPPEVRFAREYVRVLRDSGAVGVIPMTAPKTRALSGYAPNMDALRDDFAPTQTTITLDRWSAVPATGEAPALVLVVFKVEGIARPVELSLWIEESAGRYWLSTIMTRALAAKGDAAPPHRVERAGSADRR